MSSHWENVQNMLKCGEFSPNNPKMRVTTQPYLGLGEYEGRRQFLLDERKTEYQQYAEKVKKIAEQDNKFIRNSLKESRPTSKRQSSGIHKAVQTDIQDINTKLIQCDIPRDQNATIADSKIRSPRARGVTIDKVQIETQNNIIVPGYNKYFDKVAAKNHSPRAKLMADLQSSYFPTMLAYPPPAIDGTDRLEMVRTKEQYLAELSQEIEEKRNLIQKYEKRGKKPLKLESRDPLKKVRTKEQYLAELRQEIEEKRNLVQKYEKQKLKALKLESRDRLEKIRRQEQYLAELRQQVEEKHNLLQKHKEREKFLRDLEVMKLESQLKEASINDKVILNQQSYSADITTKLREYENKSKWNERPYNTQNRDKSLTPHSDISHNNITSKFAKTPPLSRNDRPPYSFNIPSNSVFANSQTSKEVYDKKNSKLVINLKSKNLTTNRSEKQIINVNRNPKLEEALPVPILKAQSPIAKELINALPVQSKTSDAMRKLEDKWQVPVVQKNIIKTSERQIPGNNQGILTQLGAIRLQLQQEQLRLDETLRKRGISQPSNITVNADVHY